MTRHRGRQPLRPVNIGWGGSSEVRGVLLALMQPQRRALVRCADCGERCCCEMAMRRAWISAPTPSPLATSQAGFVRPPAQPPRARPKS